MKTTKQLVALAIIGTVGAVQCANAQEYNNPASPYRANEFSIDLFGSGAINQKTIDNLTGNTIKENVRLGAGVGVNYFFTRFIGIGADAYAQDSSERFVDSASGNLIARLPINDSGFAPYIYGGAGYRFEDGEQRFGQAGAGLEFRFTDKWGAFVDARYVFADESDNYGVARAGVRLSF